MNQPQIGQIPIGTNLTVGTHQVKILKYLTSGGFAQIYAVEITPRDPYNDTNVACLKRVHVPDKLSLNILRAEVDAMKLLINDKHVVSYIDSHATRSPSSDNSYEVFLLMEYCESGGLIDFMNTRLQNRLTEPEVLNIMSQTTQGIAAMHALVPPLLHRDIKIENVLISKSGVFKICDFGSVSGIIRPPRNQQEFAYVQHDIMKNTTAQYRSPEMIDLYRALPIDEKSDIWALGVFLYKVCYYTTPFEKVGESAILHARFQFPSYPIYSDRLKNLIRVMLRETPADRPNICQVLEEVSRIQNVPCPIRNFYLLRAMENVKLNSQLNYPQQQLQKLRNAQLDNFQKPISVPSPISIVPNQAPPGHNLVGVNTTVPTTMVSNSLVGNGTQLWGDVDHLSTHVTPNRILQKSGTLPTGAVPLSKSLGNNDFNFTLLNRETRHEVAKYVDSVTQTVDTAALREVEKLKSNSKAVSDALNDINNDNQRDETDLEHKLGSKKSNSSLNTLKSLKSGTTPIETPPLGMIKSNTLSSLPAAINNSVPMTKVENTPAFILNANNDKRKSIQLRVQHLLENAQPSDIKKSAEGYGKYTDLSTEPAQKSKSSVRQDSPEIPDLLDMDDKLVITKTPQRLDTKRKPAPPPKPKHLRSVSRIPSKNFLHLEHMNNDRITSDATDILVGIDVDDMEEDFKRRFPSAI
ncbi:Actin-regulating kinase PRK1 [Nakaseomyces bracarensis]|uniref:non-specific serine/threonine protein kinase n=1 Tax=Nakaseomyces bracarensis TaxID=273131 RepID=A0ABR4NX18_9SACH